MKKYFKLNLLLFIKILLTIYTLYSLKYLYRLKNIESEFYMNITFIFIIAALYLLINYAVNILKNGIDKRLLIISILMGLYFAFTAILGAYYEGVSTDYYAEVIDFTFDNFVISLKYIPSLWFLLLGVILFIFIKIPQIYNDYIKQYENYTEMPKIFNKLYKIWLFIFICWLPYFILLYPGYMSWDGSWQLSHLLSNNINAHHPILSTLYMYFILLYNKLSNNSVLSIAVFVVFFQMLPLSFIYAYMINKLNKVYNVNKIIIVFLILFIALYPVNPIISIIVDKGILFLFFLILFLVKIVEIVHNKELLTNKKYIIQLIIIGAVLCLTRNNVIYGIIFIIPFMLLFARKYIKYILLLFVCIFIGYILLDTALFKITDAKKGEFRESMSMPMQQLARVYKYHKDSLSNDDIKFIESMVGNKDIFNIYNPKWSDLVKNGVDSSFFKRKEFIINYIRLGLKYPEIYFNSFLIMTSALWNPFENIFWREGIPLYDITVRDFNLKSYGFDIEYEELIKHKNKLLNNYLLTTQINVKKNNSMLTFILMNQSFLFHFFILTFIYFIYKRQYKYNFVLLIPLGYTATLFLGPIMYFRYTYFLAAIIPMFVMMLTNKDNGEELK